MKKPKEPTALQAAWLRRIAQSAMMVTYAPGEPRRFARSARAPLPP
jgi:hypothetical protein